MEPEMRVDCEYNNCTSLKSPGATIISPIAMSLTGVIGNAIAIGMIHRMKLERNRTVFYVLVAGLAWADLIGIIITTIPVILNYSHGSFFGGKYMCNYHGWAMVMIGILTPMIACGMSMERYVGIRHGYFYISHFNPARARMALLGLWLAAILFSSMPLFGFGQYTIQYPGTWCFCNLHPVEAIDAAYSITFAVLNLILIGIMIVCNIAVQCTLVAMRCGRSRADHPDQFRRTHRSRQQDELELQMMFVLLAITLVFTLCWAPLQIQILLNQFYEHKTAADHAGDLLVVRLASINQTLDPWVYILSKKLCFRKAACGCWKYLVDNKLESFRRSCSQREFIGTSSLRSHLGLARLQSQSAKRNPSWACRQVAVAKPEIVDDVPLVIQVNANGPSSVHTSVSNGPRDRPSDSTGTDQHSALQGDSLTDSRSNQNPPATQDESRRKSFINARHDWVRGRRQLDNVRLFSAPSDGGRNGTPISCDWDVNQRHRRHSWCCADAVGVKHYATQSTQTIEQT